MVSLDVLVVDIIVMQAESFLPSLNQPEKDSRQIHLELTLKLHNYPRLDREPVKILIIGSKPSVNAIVVALHQLNFAKVFEWTDFLPAPSCDRPLHFKPGEVMKALVKYLPKS
jgi:NAD(P)H-flavin reductase